MFNHNSTQRHTITWFSTWMFKLFLIYLSFIIGYNTYYPQYKILRNLPTRAPFKTIKNYYIYAYNNKLGFYLFTSSTFTETTENLKRNLYFKLIQKDLTVIIPSYQMTIFGNATMAGFEVNSPIEQDFLMEVYIHNMFLDSRNISNPPVKAEPPYIQRNTNVYLFTQMCMDRDNIYTFMPGLVNPPNRTIEIKNKTLKVNHIDGSFEDFSRNHNTSMSEYGVIIVDYTISNPYESFTKVYFPASYMRVRKNPGVFILANALHHTAYMDKIGGIQEIGGTICLNNAVFPQLTNPGPEDLFSFIGREQQQDLVTFFTYSKIEAFEEIGKKICESCVTKVYDLNKFSLEAFLEGARKTKVLVVDQTVNLAHMIALPKGAKVILLGGHEIPSWASDMAASLGLIIVKGKELGL